MIAKHTTMLAMLAALPVPGMAASGNSYVLPDGINRAPAVTLHCAVQGSMAAPCGTAANPVIVSAGAGLIAIPVGGPPVSRSLSVPAAQSTTLFAANPARRYFAFQAPQGSALWINFTGGPAAPNAPDCVYFSAGTFYESGAYVNLNAITIYSPTAATISAFEG